MSETTEKKKIPVRTDVPPDLHPEVLTPVEAVLNKPGTLGAQAYELARGALEAAYEAYARVEEAEAAVQPYLKLGKGRVRTEKSIISPALLEMTEKSEKRICSFVQNRHDSLVKLQKELTKRVAQAIDSPERRTAEGIAEASEIRRHVQALSNEKRMEFVSQRLTKADVKTLAAIIHAPPYLSGMSDDEHARWRLAAEKKFSADKAQLDAMDLVLDRVRRASTSVLNRHLAITTRRNEPAVQDAIRRERTLRALGLGGIDSEDPA